MTKGAYRIMLTRKTALESVKANIEDNNLIRHLLAVEAIMRELAKYLNEDAEEWGLVGLLHDIDMELTEGDMNAHSKLGADLVLDLGGSDSMAHAILAHNDIQGIPRETKLDKALYCADPLADLIIACSLKEPIKKIEDLNIHLVEKGYHDNGFAVGISRDKIAACHELGIKLTDFMELGLTATKHIAPNLGL